MIRLKLTKLKIFSSDFFNLTYIDALKTMMEQSDIFYNKLY